MYIRSECFRFIGSNVILLSSGFPTANVPYETRPPRKLGAPILGCQIKPDSDLNTDS